MSELGKWAASAATAFRHGLAGRGAILVRAGFFVVILLIFSRLWEAALPGRGASMVWYLALTEWILLSVPPLHLDIEHDVRSGDAAALLLRPASWLGMRIGEAVGALLARMLLFVPVAGLSALVFSGAWPEHPLGLLAALPLGVLAGIVFVILQSSIGVAAVWLQDAAPLYLLFQKLAFIFGGLLLPLDIYPGWLRAAGDFTPFPWLLYGPARLALDFSVARALGTLAALLVWGCLGALGVAWLYRRGVRALEIHAG
jgi:ABC-2 type transport system permease protein